jgi:hypothetical protein
MRTSKFASHLKAGKVYRRDDLLPFSKAVDRDLNSLTLRGVLEKVAAGLYYKPAHSLYGVLPPNDSDLVESFLKGDAFLLYSWNQYNSLGLGLTQLYNQPVVYNRKRHGLFKLGNKTFDFRRLLQGFPKELTREFLLVDLVNNLKELAEDSDLVKDKIKKNLSKFDLQRVVYNSKKYGKVGTRRFFESLIGFKVSKEMVY